MAVDIIALQAQQESRFRVVSYHIIIWEKKLACLRSLVVVRIALWPGLVLFDFCFG